MTNNYRLFLLCGLLSALGALPAQAQADIRPGYVLPLAGDTLRGLVTFHDSQQSNVVCRFQTSAATSAHLYTPAQLRGYGIGKGTEAVTYQSLAVASLPGEKLAAAVADSARLRFLEVLVNGRASLYFSRDNHRNHYYVQSPTAPVTELVFERTESASASSGTVLEDHNLFRTTLVTALAGCMSAQALLPRLPFMEAALVRVVKQYNDCGNQVALRAPRTRSSGGVSFGVIGGYHHGSMQFSGDRFFAQGQAIAQNGGVGGLSMTFVLPFSNQALQARVEALYDRQLYEAEFRTASFGAIPFAQKKRISSTSATCTYLLCSAIRRGVVGYSPS